MGRFHNQMRFLRKSIIPFILVIGLIKVELTHSQEYKVYFGDLHAHSSLSFDTGSTAKTPASAFGYARDVANLDFYAITDHANDLNDGQPLQGWQSLLDAAESATSSNFIALGSQEVGLVFASGGYGHMVLHDSPDLADNDVYPDVRFDLSDIFDFIIARNSLAHFCHPGIQGTSDDASSRFNGFAYNGAADTHMYGLEVLSGFYSDPYERYYFLALENGWHVGAVAGQDNHGANYGNRVDSEGSVNLTAALLDTLSREKLLEAFANHRTYAARMRPSSDRIYLTRFTADGNWMGEEFDNDDNVVTLEIAAHAEVKFVAAHIYKNGRLFKQINPDANDFIWTTHDSSSFGESYYFLKLVQEDMDMLWSSPIWVNSSGSTEEPGHDIVKVAELKGNLSNGLPNSLGRANFVIRGTATVANQFGSSGPGYLQDSTGGIAVFGEGYIKNTIPGYPLEMEVLGSLTFYNGSSEIRSFTVKRIGVNQSFPQVIPVATGELASNGELYEGSLIQVSNVTISGGFPSPGTNANLLINDGSGSVTLRIDSSTDIPGSPTPLEPVTITGVAGQFDPSPPYHEGYQILPRSLSDFDFTTRVANDGEQPGPDRVELSQNYPNPFNGETVIITSIPQGVATITLRIYDISGRLVHTLFDGSVTPGSRKILWDGKDRMGKNLASGIYFYEIRSRNFRKIRKMILID